MLHLPKVWFASPASRRCGGSPTIFWFQFHEASYLLLPSRSLMTIAKMNIWRVSRISEYFMNNYWWLRKQWCFFLYLLFIHVSCLHDLPQRTSCSPWFPEEQAEAQMKSRKTRKPECAGSWLGCGVSGARLAMCHVWRWRVSHATPIAGWFFLGKIPSRSGWELGVSPC